MKLIVIILLTFVASCQHSFTPQDIIMEDNASLEGTKLTSDQINYDLSLLQYALDRAYGGRKFIDSKILKKAHHQIEELKKDKSIKNSHDLGEKLGEILFSIPDNHMLITLNGRVQGASKRKKFDKTEGSVGNNILHKSKKVWGTAYRQAGNYTVPIISVFKMPQSQDSVWKDFLDTVFSIKKGVYADKYPAVIIDLRGNGGGADTMGLNMVSYLFGQDFPNIMDKIIKSRTPETLALRVNYRKVRIRWNKKKVQPYMLQDLKQSQREFEEALKGSLPEEDEYKLSPGYPYDPKKAIPCPVYVLIDKGCASSCESIVDALEKFPQRILVGENTGGYLHFGNIGHLYLKNSHLIVQLATDYWQYKDKRFLEFVGIKPDIKVKPGTDALEVALKKISQQK